MSDYAELEHDLRRIAESDAAKATLIVRFNEPTGEPDWTPFKQPSVSLAQRCTEAADALASLTRELEEAREHIDTITEQRDDADDRLQRVRQWANAYPEDIFLPVTPDDLKRADALLKAAGISMSAMHGYWARHILHGVGGIVGADISRESAGESKGQRESEP